MLTNLQQSVLNVLMANPTVYAGLTDAAAAVQMNQPILTPKTGSITYASLASSAVWGPQAAMAFQQALKAASAANTALSPLATFIDTVLSGTGLNPADPAVPAEATALVTAGLVTQAQANTALYTTSYAAGVNTVAATDITAARAQLALQQAQQAVVQQLQSVYNQGMALIQSATTTATVPTLATCLALTPQGA